MAVDDYDDNDVADFTQALHGDAWVRSNPSGAVKVLLETGALEQFAECGWCTGHDVCRFDESVVKMQCEPVYRLVTEENRDG